MTQLYILANEYRAAAAKLEELELDEKTIADTLDSLSGDFVCKAKNVAMMIRNLEVTAESLKEFERQQKERRNAIERKVDSIRDYLERCMKAIGILSIDTPELRIGFRSSSFVVIDNQIDIPDEYTRIPEPIASVPDKKLIADAIKSGHEVPGAHIEKRLSLVIK